MIPRIAVQRGLEQVSNMLSHQGYQVVPLEEVMGPVDAIIYSGVTCEWEGIPATTNLAGPDEVYKNELLINTVGMSPTQVLDLIHSRLGGA